MSQPTRRDRPGPILSSSVPGRATTPALATVACLAFVACAACGGGGAGGPTPPEPPAPQPTTDSLTWQDEFDGPAGTTFDHTKWTTDLGGGGWGNQELEYYTADTANVALDGQGHLVITARAEPATSTDACWYGRCLYTSARLKSQFLFTQLYGRFEARMKLPRGQGVWPAFWMLGSDIGTVGWPTCGEIDVMENIGREPNVVHGTLHGPGYSGGNGIGTAYTLPAALADDFHVYSVEWRPGEVKWFIDGVQYFRVDTSNIPNGTHWAFDHPFFLLLNFAVGGGWPGSPDATTVFPQRLVVDYVRVTRLGSS